MEVIYRKGITVLGRVPYECYLLGETGSGWLLCITKWRTFKNSCGKFENFPKELVVSSINHHPTGVRDHWENIWWEEKNEGVYHINIWSVRSTSLIQIMQDKCIIYENIIWNLIFLLRWSQYDSQCFLPLVLFQDRVLLYVWCLFEDEL